MPPFVKRTAKILAAMILATIATIPANLALSKYLPEITILDYLWGREECILVDTAERLLANSLGVYEITTIQHGDTISIATSGNGKFRPISKSNGISIDESPENASIDPSKLAGGADFSGNRQALSFSIGRGVKIYGQSSQDSYAIFLTKGWILTITRTPTCPPLIVSNRLS